tara:strand:- start:321 stop:1316 length:996 start_codon:yes stop_codon:yes gene_type:complete
MDSVFTAPPPSFEKRKINEILNSQFGFYGIVKNLYGDRDQNFLIRTKKNIYILKVYNPAEKKEIIELQDAAIKHIKNRNSYILLPSTVNWKTIKYKDQIFYFRLLEYIEGDFIYKKNMTLDDHKSLGSFMGELSRAFVGFDHQAAHRVFEWDCRQTNIIKNNLRFINKRKNKNIILQFLNEYKKNVIPLSENLRMAVIHNDGNDHNIIINDRDQAFGIIDFGDIIYSFQIIEASVAIAYIYLNNKDPFEKIFSFLKGYQSAFELNKLELKSILYFMSIRLCITVTMSAWRKILFPDNKYLTISEEPAWSALNRLAKENLSKLSKDIIKNVQ